MREQVNITTYNNKFLNSFKEQMMHLFDPDDGFKLTLVWEILLVTLTVMSTYVFLSGNPDAKSHWIYTSGIRYIAFSMLAFDLWGRFYISPERYKLSWKKAYKKQLFTLSTAVDVISLSTILIPGWAQSFAFISLLGVFPALGLSYLFQITWFGLKKQFKMLITVLFSAFALFMMFGVVTLLISLNDPEAFEPYIDNWWDAFYYSFVTGSTLGFGDIHPNTFAAQVWTIIMAISGIIITAILISIIVYGVMNEYNAFKEVEGTTNKIKLLNLKNMESLDKQRRKYKNKKLQSDIDSLGLHDSIFSFDNIDEISEMSLEQIEKYLDLEEIYYPDNIKDNKKALLQYIEDYVFTNRII